MNSSARKTGRPKPASAALRKLRDELAEFVRHEVQLLDERRYDEWASLFAADGVYWVPAQLDQASPTTHVSLFYDDRATIQTRVTRLRHPQIHVQTPHSRTIHTVSNFRTPTRDRASGLTTIESNFLMLEYRPGWPQQLFGGRYRHTLRRTKGGYEIVMKRVDLVNCDGTFPALSVPF
ncbi:MAG: aromatic-ring-hydroxylating dioxygenase subunit beta [Alphaproteobacteria bacterium]|nr:aromatic-ring-hydroxylating dioxygenase subunit beta [Alphaproteobacteria bacterium]